MTWPKFPRLKQWFRFGVLGMLAVAVVAVLAVLAYLLVTLQLPATSPPAAPTAGAAAMVTASRRPALRLPTASLPTVTAGPPEPRQELFVAKEPIKGFSDCERIGVKGIVSAGNSEAIRSVQIVLWHDQVGLLALDAPGSKGEYSIDLANEGSPQQMWVQIYQNDLPVSMPVLIKTHIDCQNGFQIYQIDWVSID